MHPPHLATQLGWCPLFHTQITASPLSRDYFMYFVNWCFHLTFVCCRPIRRRAAHFTFYVLPFGSPLHKVEDSGTSFQNNNNLLYGCSQHIHQTDHRHAASCIDRQMEPLAQILYGSSRQFVRIYHISYIVYRLSRMLRSFHLHNLQLIKFRHWCNRFIAAKHQTKTKTKYMLFGFVHLQCCSNGPYSCISKEHSYRHSFRAP